VIVANPATAPVTIPTEVALPMRMRSIAIQVRAAAAAAKCVLRIAEPAAPSAVNALPR